MEPLPQPPQLDGPPPLQRTPPRAGQLTLAWRTVFIVGWAGVVLGLGSVVKSSRTMGLSTWWLGPDADPRPIVVQLLPFVLPAVAIILGFRNARFLPFAGTIAALGLGAIAVGDVGRFDALAQVELATAGIGLLVSLAAFGGVLRAAPGGSAPASAAAGGVGTASGAASGSEPDASDDDTESPVATTPMGGEPLPAPRPSV